MTRQTSQMLEDIKRIFILYQKHQAACDQLQELTLNESFHRSKVQGLVDYYVKQGQRICKHVERVLEQN